MVEKHALVWSQWEHVCWSRDIMKIKFHLQTYANTYQDVHENALRGEGGHLLQVFLGKWANKIN